MNNKNRLDAEWVSVNALRGLSKIATQGDMEKSTYDNALNLGGVLYPELLGDDVSILRRERESDLTREYRQKAELKTIQNYKKIEALELIKEDIAEYTELLNVAKKQKENRTRVDQLKRKLKQLYKSEKELQPSKHSETQLIFRDAYNVERSIPSLSSNKGYRDFKLSNDKIVRLRVLHPDNIEHITGADLVYERHSPKDETVSIVAVQYKIWENRKMYLSNERMQKQIEKMRSFLCNKDICSSNNLNENEYRFPCCSAFLRPTDKLQKEDQRFISTGEHLPICKIDKCKSIGPQGGEFLEYNNIKDISISNDMFEFLFNKGKIGSKQLTYDELEKVYEQFLDESSNERVIVYAQEFDKYF
ncbi:hypothetical protein [Aquimarina macrocephali]|uniref:hypothetical protein n=1 Tax=Aquimarina macrocephali TaxID=666563 RepID=UPI000466CB53|nr:hypothetical protein [Aquimarina macrocephali]